MDYSILDIKTLNEIRGHWQAEKRLCKEGEIIESLVDERLSQINQELKRRK